MTFVKRLTGNTSHVEIAKGSSDQNIKYCSKEPRVGQIYRYGDPPRTSKRKLKDMVQMIRDGNSLLQCYEEDCVGYANWHKKLKAVQNLEFQKRSRKFRTLEVLVYVGDAGSGKTRHALEIDPDLFIVPNPENNRLWFDGYQGEKTILIDDFYGWIKYHHLLRILDGYQIQMQTKGGFVWGLWERVIITSNKHPKDWYKVGMTAALKRRLTEVRNFHTMAMPDLIRHSCSDSPCSEGNTVTSEQGHAENPFRHGDNVWDDPFI